MGNVILTMTLGPSFTLKHINSPEKREGHTPPICPLYQKPMLKLQWHNIRVPVGSMYMFYTICISHATSLYSIKPFHKKLCFTGSYMCYVLPFGKVPKLFEVGQIRYTCLQGVGQIHIVPCPATSCGGTME